MPDVLLHDRTTWRIIPSRYPEIGIWDRIGIAAEIDDFLAIEALTNDRIREVQRKIARVRVEDRISGRGTTQVMSAFAYGHAGRFNDDSFGAYYAAFSEVTALAESVHERERFLRATKEPSIDLDMRVYTALASGRYDDVRKRPRRDAVYDPASHLAGRIHGLKVRKSNTFDGVVYRSPRRWADGECVAAFRPRCVTNARAMKHLRYTWDGNAIGHIYAVTIVPMTPQ